MKANCKNCNKEFEFREWESEGKYCSNKCQAKYQFENDTKKRFYEGKIWVRNTLRNVLMSIDPKCNICGLETWNDKPITLEVDHIDGNASDNRPENLRLLCPNCHSQTAYFCGRNKGKGRGSRGIRIC